MKKKKKNRFLWKISKNGLIRVVQERPRAPWTLAARRPPFPGGFADDRDELSEIICFVFPFSRRDWQPHGKVILRINTGETLLPTDSLIRPFTPLIHSCNNYSAVAIGLFLFVPLVYHPSTAGPRWTGTCTSHPSNASARDSRGYGSVRSRTRKIITRDPPRGPERTVRDERPGTCPGGGHSVRHVSARPHVLSYIN